MKALTLTQPWATLVAIGGKRIETRSWKTDYRGPLAIHAAKGWTKEVVDLAMRREPFRSVLTAAGYPLFSLLPRGCVVATCELVDCRTTDLLTDRTAAYTDGPGRSWPLDDQERAFGDFTPGRYAWLLANVQPLPKPVPARGALSLRDWNKA